MNRILAPVDFSERSIGAARYTEALSRHFGAKTTLLHVLSPPHYEFSSMEVGGTVIGELFEMRTQQVRREFDEFLVSELPELRAERVLLEGDPSHKIVEYAHDNQIDLIVVPTHGYGPFRRFILGSVTAKILHDADCPVWTGIHLEEAPAVEEIGFRSVLAAIDLGPQSKKVLDWATAVAESYGARLLLMHATPCMDSRAKEFDDQEWHEEVTRECEADIGKLLAQSTAEAEVMVESGDPAEVVCSAAKQTGADLMVIGRSSAAGVFGRLRANAYSIIRMSPCPVVSV